MPWALTTPVTTGDLDASDYAQVSIVDFRHNSKRNQMSVTLEYGNTVGDDWVGGHPPAGKTLDFEIVGTDYDALVTDVSGAGELTYAAVKRALYAWLNTNGHIDAGSVV